MQFSSKYRLFYAIALLFLVFSCEQKEETIPSKTIKATETKVAANEYLDLVNAIRKEGAICGSTNYAATTPLAWNSVIEKTAYMHSKDMADNNYFGHISFSGTDGGKRLISQAYNWTAWGENLFKATGYTPTKKQVIEAWKNSASHCQNLMNPKFKEMGIGEYNNNYTQVFGSK